MNTLPLNDCGCCEGVEPQTPAAIDNRHGLRAIAYRCGTHAQFKQSMLAALSSSAHPALARLATRDDDDFSIALLDAWATTADVLTFYQERIAQESFLRTATERRSLLELGRLIGYELRSGVAASTYLAFTVEAAAGAPPATTIQVGNKVQSIPGPDEKPQLFETIEQIEARPEWNEIRARQTRPQTIDATTAVVYLDGLATNLRKGDNLLLLGPETPGVVRAWDVCRIETIELEAEKKRTRVAFSERPAHFAAIPATSVQVFAMRQRAALFGYNAPDRRVLPDATLAKFDEPTFRRTTSAGFGGFFAEALTGLGPQDWPFKLSGNTVDLDTTYPAITAGSWITLTNSSDRALGLVSTTTEVGRTDYTLTGKVTRLAVTLVASPDVAGVSDFGGGALRATVLLGDSQELKFTEEPVPPTIAGTSLVVAQRLEGFRRGRVLAITGTKPITDEPFSGLVTLASAVVAGPLTTLTFTPALPELKVESVRINANVALATQGETVSEILGSADASEPFQRFALKQPPLTYVRAPGVGGARSTLQVRVNDVLWHEVPTLYGCGPADRVYVTRTNDEGVTTVQFGDGITAARPPTGQDNLRATYRRGIGVEGLVKTNQLSLLLTRPLGLKGVTNPTPSEGAANREQLADARGNAPLSVLTLDRIVSLQDYEDFVRAFAGVAKAFATWTWDGQKRGVFVTVAGPFGAEIDLDGDFGVNLYAAIAQACVPGVPVRVQSYRRADGLFTVSGRVKIDPAYETPRVLAAVRQSLSEQFSFEARSFGAPVLLSEVITAMQTVAGVVAVDVDELRRLPPPAPPAPATSRFVAAFARVSLRNATLSLEGRAARPTLFKRPPTAPRLNSRLVAALPQAGARGTVAPAELLVLAPLLPEQIGVLP